MNQDEFLPQSTPLLILFTPFYSLFAVAMLTGLKAASLPKPCLVTFLREDFSFKIVPLLSMFVYLWFVSVTHVFHADLVT